MKIFSRLILATSIVLLVCSCAKKPNYYLNFYSKNNSYTQVSASLIKTLDKIQVDNLDTFAIKDATDIENWIFQFEYGLSDCYEYLIIDKVQGKTDKTNARGFQKYLKQIDFNEWVEYSFFKELERKITKMKREAL